MDSLQRDNGSTSARKNIGDHAAVRAPPVMVSDAPMTQAHVRVPDSVDRSEWIKLRSRRRSGRRRASSAAALTPPTFAATPPSHSRKMSMDSTTSSLATETSLRSAMSTPPQRGHNVERVRRSVTFAVEDDDGRRRPSLDSEPRRRTTSSVASSAVRKIFPSSSSSSLASSQHQQCGVCRAEFTRYRRPHRCRACGKAVCATCSPARLPKRTCKPCAGDSAIPRVFPVVSPARGRASPYALPEETASATRAARFSVGAPVVVSADAGVFVTAAAREAAVVGVSRVEEVGRAGTEEGSSSLDGAGNMRLGGSVSEDRVGKGKPEDPTSLGGEGGLGVDSVGESESRGSSSLRDTSRGREVWRPNGVSVAGDQHVEHLDGLDGTGSNIDGCGSATRVDFGTQLSPTGSLRNDYPSLVTGSMAAAATVPPVSAAAGLDGLPPPTTTPGLNTFTTVPAADTDARQAVVVVDGGSKPREERTVTPASGEDVKPEEKEGEDSVSIATGNEEGSAVPEVEDEPEVRPAPVPAALLHPPLAAASVVTEPRCGQTHLPLDPNEATREQPPPSVEFEGGTEIARLGVPDPGTRADGGGVVSAPLRHRGPLEEDSQFNAKREEDEEKEEEEVEEEGGGEEEEEEEGEEGGGQGDKEEEVLEEDVSAQQQETNGSVETMEEGLRFTGGRINDGSEGGKDVSGAAARLSAEKRCGEGVTDAGTADVPFVLLKHEEGDGEVAEDDGAEGVGVETEEGECDREALVLVTGLAVDGRVKEQRVEEDSEPMGPLVTAAVPQGKQQQEQQQEEDGEGEGEKEVEEQGGEREEGGREVEEEEERETETVLILGNGMAVDDHVKEEPVGEDSEPMGPLDGLVKEEQDSQDNERSHSLLSAAVPQGKQQQQEQQQEEQEQEGEKEEEEEEERGGEEEEEEEEEQQQQEGGVDEEGASVEGEDVAVGDDTPAPTSVGTITDSTVNDHVAEQKTSGLPVALRLSHEGGGGTDDEKFGEDEVEEGEEASTVGVRDTTEGHGHATDSLNTTAMMSAGEGGTADNAVEGEGSCSHEAGSKTLDSVIDSIARASGCKEEATQHNDVAEKAAAEGGEACNYSEEGSDALGSLVDGVGSAQHEQAKGKPQEAEEDQAPSRGTAWGTASENRREGDNTAVDSGGVEGATVDATMGRVDETAHTMRSDSEAIDGSRAGRGSAREASRGSDEGGRNGSNWLAVLKGLVEKGGSCCR